MKHNYIQRFLFVTLLLSGFAVAESKAQSCFNCGSGADGAYTATANTTLAGGTYNYTTFNISSGVTVTVTGTQPLIIRCTGTVTLNGVLAANGGNGTNGITFTAAGTGGIGVAGGQNGGNGTYSTSLGGMLAGNGAGAGGVGTAGNGWSGGGGAGHSAVGAASGGSSGGFGGPIYGDAQLSAVLGGSGGGGGSGGFSCGSGGGGAGGGYIEISSCANILIAAGGGVQANGGNGGSDGTGNCGGGGAGSGGTVWLAAASITNNGQVRAVGGTGGASAIPGSPYFGIGGNGANGRIRVDGTLAGSGTMVPTTFFTGPPLTVSPSSAASICNGNSTTLNATGNGGTGSYTFNWMPGNLSGSSVTVSPSTTTTYTVTITDAVNCTSTATTTLTVNPLPIVTLNGATTLCAGGSIQLSGSPGGSVQWYANGLLIPSATTAAYTVSAPGLYNMIQTNANGCSDSASVGITVVGVPNPTVALGADTTFCQSVNGYLLTAQTNALNYLWSNNSTLPSIVVNSSGTYSVQVADTNSCEARDTIVITILPLPVITFVPAQDTFCLSNGPVALTATPVGGTYTGPGISGSTFSAQTAGVGQHTLTYTYVDSMGCSATSAPVIMSVDVCTGVQTASAVSAFIQLYPNPTNGVISITTTTGGLLSIYTALGQEVQHSKNSNAARQEIDLTTFGAGIYLVRFVHAGGVEEQRVVVQ